MGNFPLYSLTLQVVCFHISDRLPVRMLKIPLCVCVCECVCVCVFAQSYLTLHDPMDCSPPGSSVHGILQARIPEWVAVPFSRGSSWIRD